jgi:uncharacterized protein (TIGR02996 family)
MTTEEDFQAGLDREPDNHHLRLVFADWLEERGDERALGVRALGVLKLRPHKGFQWYTDNFVLEEGQPRVDPASDLPNDWWQKLSQGEAMAEYDVNHRRQYDVRRNIRRVAEDDAARAFLKLPVERQQELLRQPVLV